MPAPRVFISYSHDSPLHKDWVLGLATALRNNGIDAVLDQWDLTPGQDIAAFMDRGISTADRVLLICTGPYVSKAEAGVGGVGYERLIVTTEVVASIDTIKFIPIIRSNASARKVPKFLGPRMYVDFTDDAQYSLKLEELMREILGAPAAARPALGENPFKGDVIESAEPVRVVGPGGATLAGVPILDGEWFQVQHTTATANLAKLYLAGSMEVRFGLHNGLNKTQIELLTAVRASQIHTFGWPIGVLLENHPEHKPRPFGDGIRTEAWFGGASIGDQRTSYDYWALRKSGDFYLLQSLFEDGRDRGALFFNTRIVRVTEALLFARNLYTALGANGFTDSSGFVYNAEAVHFGDVGGKVKLLAGVPSGGLLWMPYIAGTVDQRFGFSHTLAIPDQAALPGGDLVNFAEANTFWGGQLGLDVTGPRGLTVGIQGFYAASTDTNFAGGNAYVRIPLNYTERFALRY
jgi:hypothetical protein